MAEFVWLRKYFICELCGNFDEHSDSIKNGNFFTRLMTISSSKMTTVHIFSYNYSAYLNSFDLIVQTTEYENTYICACPYVVF